MTRCASRSAASDRAAWIDTITYALRAVFDAAAELGDAQLIAELVEVSVNVGVHTTEADPLHPDGQMATIADADPGGRTEPPSVPSGPHAGIRLAAGAARLVPGAELPLAPPPRLRMPGGKIALDRYLSLAHATYGIRAAAP